MATRAPSPKAEAPAGAATTCVRHRVPFFETDAMGIVHHSNYVRYLELARIQWLKEHDRSYADYVAEGLHFTVTAIEVDYVRPTRFDDEIEVHVWLEWIRGASLRMAYRLRCRDELVVTAATEHAMVDTEGRVRRIPRQRREAMSGKLGATPAAP